MKSFVLSSALVVGVAYAEVAAYYQCGGKNWTGETTCVAGWHCQYQNPFYSQCVYGSGATTLLTVTGTGTGVGTGTGKPACTGSSNSTVAVASSIANSKAVSSTSVISASAHSNPLATAKAPSASSTRISSSGRVKTKAHSSSVASAKPASTTSVVSIPHQVATSSSKVVSTSSAVATSSTVATSTKVATSSKTSSTASASGKVKLAGINISGFDFGCGTDGTCTVSGVDPPLTSSNGADGIGQMKHFNTDDNLNVFRLPVGWQYLQTDYTDADLDSTNLATYDQLVQGCLATGAYCVIDIHNYARWNGQIIGQGGPSNDNFANLWSKLAANYANETNIIFGVMNEPHDVDITEWATTVQAAVTAIRKAGATSQYVLLPGNNYASAAQFVDNGSAAALVKVTNPDGTTDNLVFDVHQYSDSDNSGTNSECVTNNIANAFEPLATWLRTNNRLAFNTESGGGNVASCEQYLCEQYAYME